MKRVALALCAVLLLLCACSMPYPKGTVCYHELHTNSFTYEDVTALQAAEPFQTQTPEEGTEVYLFEGGTYLNLQFDYLQYTFTADTRSVTCYLTPEQDEGLSGAYDRVCAALEQQFGPLENNGVESGASYQDSTGNTITVRGYDETVNYDGTAVVIIFKFT